MKDTDVSDLFDISVSLSVWNESHICLCKMNFLIGQSPSKSQIFNWINHILSIRCKFAVCIIEQCSWAEIVCVLFSAIMIPPVREEERRQGSSVSNNRQAFLSRLHPPPVRMRRSLENYRNVTFFDGFQRQRDSFWLWNRVMRPYLGSA